MKKRHFLLAGAVLMLLCSQYTQAPAADMKEGLWEMTMHMDMPGMPPEMKGKPMTTRHCYTAKEIESKDFTKDELKHVDGQDQCKVITSNHSGNTFKSAMECKGEDGAMRIESVTTVNKEQYETISKIRFLDGEMKGMESNTKVSAKWIGPCNNK